MTGIPIDQAREVASKILNERGWLFVPEGAEWRHPDGRRGRMCYFPDHDADPKDRIVQSVKLQFPNDPETKTVGEFLDVWEVEP